MLHNLEKKVADLTKRLGDSSKVIMLCANYLVNPLYYLQENQRLKCKIRKVSLYAATDIASLMRKF